VRQLKAASARKVWREITTLTIDERSDFTRFVLSLRARHPDAVAAARLHGSEALVAALARDPEEYMAIKEESSPKSLTEWVCQKAPSLIPNFGISVVPAVDKTGERVFTMEWPIQQRSATGRVLALKKTSRGVR
jgi:hypothetical protein